MTENGGMKKILMACPNYWHSPFQVGSHHLARGFLRAGWQVGFISDPLSPFHWLKGRDPDISRRAELAGPGGVWQEENLWTFVPFTALPPQNRPLLRSEAVYRRWSALCRPGHNDRGGRRLRWMTCPSSLCRSGRFRDRQ